MIPIKRISAPKHWRIRRKEKKYSFHPLPGPHAKEKCLTLGMALRDMLAITENAKESRSLLRSGQVKVDGRPRKEPGFPIGIMDVVTVGNESWRVLAGRRGLYLKTVTGNESAIKLLKITNKTVIRGGKVQLNFHDGRNLIVEKSAAYHTGDVAVFDLEKNSIKETIQLKKGATVLIVEGHNMGTTGKVESLVNVRSMLPNKIVFKAGGQSKETLMDYAFVVGGDKPAIDVEAESSGEV